MLTDDEQSNSPISSGTNSTFHLSERSESTNFAFVSLFDGAAQRKTLLSQSTARATLYILYNAMRNVGQTKEQQGFDKSCSFIL